MVTTVTNNSVQQINTSLFSLEKMINELDKKTSNHTGKGLTKINNINLNNLTQNGIYYSLGKDNLVNKPDDSMHNNIIEVVSQGNELIVQTFTYLVENEIYVRNKLNNGSWTDWVIVSNNLTNVVTSVNGKQGVVTLTASDIEGFAEVATSGSYKDLSNKPTIRTVKFVDYRWYGTMSAVNQQVQIPLSAFGSEVTPSNVLNFMVIHWSGFQAFANADWTDTQGVGLACALTALTTGTGYAKIRCVYFV